MTTNNKIIFGIVGSTFIVGTIISSVKNLGSWSSAEQVLYNATAILAIGAGAYLIYLAFKKDNLSI